METGTVHSVDIDEQMRTAYLDYAMSVIIARAIPDARDGLKPVHRRILYAMDDMGMRANGAYTCLVSGGFTLFTTRVAELIGFQENRANELLVEDSKLTGKVAEPILGREAKLATLVDLRESFDIDNLDTMVVGDGANDLAMIEQAGAGVAYHAKPAVAAAAGMRIDHGDLTALLYIQGYRRSEFVTS